jgi:hypothetical protein
MKIFEISIACAFGLIVVFSGFGSMNVGLSSWIRLPVPRSRLPDHSTASATELFSYLVLCPAGCVP